MPKKFEKEFPKAANHLKRLAKKEEFKEIMYDYLDKVL